MNTIVDIFNKNNKFSPEQISQILAEAKKSIEDHPIEFAGTVKPHDAWKLFLAKQAIIVDVRTYEERKFVGYIKNSAHVPWVEGTALVRNSNFLQQLSTYIEAHQIVLLLCRSGKRSSAAASVAFNAGHRNVFNIDQGFEGDLDPNSHRGTFNGWRYHHLPWVQE